MKQVATTHTRLRISAKASCKKEMDKISETLGAATGTEIVSVPAQETAVTTTNSTSDLTAKLKEMRRNLGDDYDFARRNLKEVLEQAMQLLPNAISLAREAESPRAYESTSAFIKTIADINKDLLEITERNIKQGGIGTGSGRSAASEGESSASVTNNSIFVGSTEDLFAKLIQTQKSVIDAVPECK